MLGSSLDDRRRRRLDATKSLRSTPNDQMPNEFNLAVRYATSHTLRCSSKSNLSARATLDV